MPACTICSTTDRRATVGTSFIRLLVAALLLGTAGCGYRALRLSTPVILEAVQGEVPAVDALPVVEQALHRALREGGTGTSTRSAVRLRVWVVQAEARLSSFSEPALRAGQYDAQIRLMAEVIEPSGATRWRRHFVGTTPFLSPPGGLESLDGTARRALQRAADEAARRVVEALRDPPVTTSSVSSRAF